MKACKELAGMRCNGLNSSPIHPDFHKPAIKKSEASVQSVVDHLRCTTNVFSTSDSLINLTSGVHAPNDVCDDLLLAEAKGQVAMRQFVNDWLLSSAVDFHDPTPTSKLLTFTSLLKPVCVGYAASQTIL